MISAREALDRLREGNARFVGNRPRTDSHSSHVQRAQLMLGQSPFAVILGCSDSRVPVEIIFDQGLGELFVIRVAGNVIGPALIGSVEYAAAHLGSRLVAVMGHSQCGAVTAAVEELQKPTSDLTPSIKSIVDRIRPSVEEVMDGELKTRDALVNESIRANVRASAEKLRQGSPLLQEMIDQDGLRIIGANYSLSNGIVEFFDGVPLD